MERKEKKKIAIVSSLDYRGGTELSLLALLKHLHKEDCDVTLFLLAVTEELLTEVPDWVNVVVVKSTGALQCVKKNLRNREYGRAICCIANSTIRTIDRRVRPQIRMSRYAMMMCQYEKFADEFDLAITWHLPDSIHTVYTLQNIRAKRKMLWIHMDVSIYKTPADAGKYYAQYDKICCVSYACKRLFDKKFPDFAKKTDVFYNIIDVDSIRSLGKQDVTDMQYNGVKIATCGRLSSEKQSLLAVDIAKELHNRGLFGFRWYFVGDGDLREKLQDQINREGLQDTIVILGLQENPYKYVSKADIFVQMSRHESFCLTLAEAQILGIPTVTTNFPSSYEIVEDGVTGYIVENSWMAICDKIELLLTDKSKRSEMKQHLASYELKANGSAEQLMEYLYS